METAGPDPAGTTEIQVGDAPPGASAPIRLPDSARSDVAPGAAWRFALVALAASALFWAIYAALVLTDVGQRIENLALMGAALRSDSDREESLANLTGVSLLVFGIAIIAVIGLALVRRRPGLAALTAGMMIFATIAAEGLKDTLPRPELVSGPAWILRNSFPSGHATVAAAIGIGALLAAPDRLRWLVIPIGAGYAALIGQATQITGWHRLSGAIAGVVLVIAISAIALVILASTRRVHRSSAGRMNTRLRRALAGVGGAILLFGLVVAALPMLFPVLLVPEGAAAVFTHTSFDLVGFGFTTVAFLAFAGVIEPYSLG